MTNPHADWDIPVDPDTDAVGDRGYGEESVHQDILPDQDQGDDSSEVSTGVHEFDDPEEHSYEYDPGDYVGTDSDQWNELGFELPHVRNPREDYG